MAILSSSCRRFSYLHRILLRLSTDAASNSGTINSPPPLSASAAKSRLRKEFDPDKALAIISSLPNNPSSPVSSGRYAVELAVRRLTRAHRFADVESLLESRKSDPSSLPEAFVSTLILSYGSARMLGRAIATFEDVPRLCSAPPTVVSFNALLSAAIRAKKHRQVHKLFSEISSKYSISPNRFSYGVLLKALCLSEKTQKALGVLKEMEEKGIEVTAVIYTTLMDSLYKAGKPERAQELWKEMVEKDCHPDLAAYNVKIMHQALYGRPEEVMESISELEAAGLKPDTITFNYLMDCYSRNAGFDDAKEVYKRISVPNASTFKIMLNILCEKGDFEAGFNVFKDSMKHNKIPDFQRVRSLVVGLAKNSKVEEAKMVIRVIRERYPESLIGGWKKVEEELGLQAEEVVAGKHELL
ncbi:Pentatricopeptide repeat-containing protein [Apostasia shenzhenica]|uniref:Pentatricopeptide repeat-containing protein n=1 Tax=Apostasia shenzhenica TaxID=1088818 RepID=A0A2I0B4M4_9ASPA|nr:Pentatricopeptide repeat-containing protein [Apostasia shenzhenica]